MEGDGFLTDILLNGGDGDVAGLDDLNFPIIWVVELLNFSLLVFFDSAEPFLIQQKHYGSVCNSFDN